MDTQRVPDSGPTPAVIGWLDQPGLSRSSDAKHAADTDVARGGVHRLRIARRRPVTLALGRFAFRLTPFFDEHQIRVMTIMGTAILSAAIGEDPIA